MPLPAAKPDRILPSVLILLLASILLGLVYYSASPVGLQDPHPSAATLIHRHPKHPQSSVNHPAEAPK